MSQIRDNAVVMLGYLAGAAVGFSFAFQTDQVSTVWPPAGVALAAFVLRGPTVWPGVFLAAAICNVAIGTPLLTALGIAIGNTFAPLAGAQCLLKKTSFRPGLSRLSDVFKLTVTILLTMAVTAANGALNLALGGLVAWHWIAQTSALWWVGDSMGAVLVAPVILTWASQREALEIQKLPELALCLSGTAFVSLIVFSSSYPLAYPVFPLVVWTALRFGQRYASLAMLAVAAVALWFTIYSKGAFNIGNPDYRLAMLVTFMAVLSITALTIGAMASERVSAEAELISHNLSLEQKVWSRTFELGQANIELARSEEQFRGAFETSAIGMAIVSTDGRWLRVNNAICDMLGYTEDELLATNFQSITYPDDLSVDIGHVQTLLKGDADSYQLEKRYLHKDGRVIFALLSVSMVRSADQRPLHFVAQVVDITKRKEIKAALVEARIQADAANRAKNMFLANISHELRTPMTGVLGFADLLMDTRLSGQQQRYVGQIKQASNALLELLDDILDLTKIEAGRIDFDYAPASVEEIISETVALFAVGARQRGLSINITFKDRLPLACMIDAKRFRQILTNLISNAVKYTHAGSITVELLSQNQTLCVRVSDTGIGISAADQRFLFQNFSRLQNNEASGTGLGLAIAKRLVEGMQGSIDVESAEGVGSTFSFTLPLRPATRLPTTPVQSVVSHTPLSVLLVEDTEMNQTIIKALLERAGHRVSVATDGLRALEQLRIDRFDLILMDIQMPRLDGIETTRQIRESNANYAKIPIIALSANAMTDEIESYERAGMDGFVAKPINRDVMLAKIQSVAGLESRTSA